MLHPKSPPTCRVDGHIDVRQRLKDLERWEQEYQADFRRLDDELMVLDMRRRIDAQKATQINGQKTRLRLKKVREPIEINTEAINELGFKEMRRVLERQFATLTQEEKLLWMNNFHFIMTPDLRTLCNKIDNVRGFDSMGQQRNFLLGGRSGMGKTTFLNWYISWYMPTVGSEANHIPIVKVDAPVEPTPKVILQRIIRQCGAIYYRSDNEEDLLMKVIFYFQKCKVEMLFIDEIEHISGDLSRRRILEISNLTTGIPILCASCNPLHFRDNDEEVAGRWNDFFLLRPFKGDKLRQLLAFLELLLPFSKRSHLTRRELPNGLPGPAQFIEEKTEGIPKNIIQLLQDGAKKALEKNEPNLSMERLHKTWANIQSGKPTRGQQNQ